MEAMFVVVVGGIIAAIAIPVSRYALRSYRLGSATAAVRSAIQMTRYQAIMQGYHYRVAFNQATQTYQISRRVPPGTTFSNYGEPVVWSASSEVSVAPSTTLEFLPGGTVKATTGAVTFMITNGHNTSAVTVSEVGDVSITP
jgi:Tfp pilus assembly protein FimT